MKPVLFLLAFLAVSILSGRETGRDFLSNRFTKPETYDQVSSKFDVLGYSKVAESESIELWINHETTSIRVLDRRTGYVWGDVLEGENAYNDLNVSWKGIARSALLIEYYNERGILAVRGSADKLAKRSISQIPDGAAFRVDFEDLGISVGFSIRVEDKCVVFRLNSDEVSEERGYSLGSIIFAPFFASSVEDEIDGYMFVPDGPGALVRFSQASNYSNWFEKRVYGKDYSIENLTIPNDLRAGRPNDFLREEPTVLMPVYGVVHGVRQNALFGVITSGAEYSSVFAYPAGVLSDYNRAGVKFIFRQRYLQPTSRSGAGVQVVQSEKNSFDAEIRLFFLEGREADYVGMAKFYRTEFSEELFGDSADKEARGESELPLAVTVIASDIEKGLLGYGIMSTTTAEEAMEIVRVLQELKVNSVRLFMEGWQKGGVHGNKISGLSFENAIGGREALIDLARDSRERGYELILVDNVTKVSDRQINVNREVGINLSQSSIFEERDNKDLWLHRFYYSNVKLASDYIQEKAVGLAKLGFSNLALKEYGSKLYGDMTFNKELPRNEAQNLIEKTLAQARSSGVNVYLYSPNCYTWRYASGIMETPMNNSQYLFQTDTVPFLQIVLSGVMEYYTPYMNNSFFSRNDVLKAIEYGAYPSFVVTRVDNYEMKNTPLWDYPSTKFEDWKEEIMRIYFEMKEALDPLIGSRIVDREVLGPGVVRVDYDNGLSIAVNYTESRYESEIVGIDPRSWKSFERVNVNYGVGGL